MKTIANIRINGQEFSETFLARFYSKISVTASCWFWTGATNKQGYGVINKGGHGMGNILASRAMWALSFGPIPETQEVCHNCPGGDNPLCVNPAHLWLGTHADNFADGVVKCQMKAGEEHYRHILKADDVRHIRSLRSAGGLTYAALGEMFGVSLETIRDVIKGYTWARIP